MKCAISVLESTLVYCGNSVVETTPLVKDNVYSK